MSTEVGQRQAAESPGPQRTPAAVADNAVALSAGATVPAWSDSPRQLKQAEQLTQLQPAAAPASHGGLPENLRSGIEALSGIDMSGVRVHRNSSKPAALQAHAYAQGQDIHLGPGQEKHLPHEAWHVVQQAQGRVRPTVQMKAGVPVNDDAGLEREADLMGTRALSQGRSSKNAAKEATRPDTNTLAGSQRTAQRLAVFSGESPPTDVNIVMTLDDIARSVGGPVVHSEANPAYQEHKSIGLLAHGSQGRIEWNDKSLSGKALVDNELTEPGRSIQPNATLEIWSCSAGERTEAGNDSLVDEVRGRLAEMGIEGVTVRGVKGLHIVLNDRGDHYVPSDNEDVESFNETFCKLRNYYLWLFGFFSDALVRGPLGGFVHERVGVGAAWHPVLYPRDSKEADELIGDLSCLFEAEKEVGGIAMDLDYELYLQQRKAAWMRMCSFLRGNSAFRSITERVDADWLELRT